MRRDRIDTSSKRHSEEFSKLLAPRRNIRQQLANTGVSMPELESNLQAGAAALIGERSPCRPLKGNGTA
jgi:hypothetical protein